MIFGRVFHLVGAVTPSVPGRSPMFFDRKLRLLEGYLVLARPGQRRWMRRKSGAGKLFGGRKGFWGGRKGGFVTYSTGGSGKLAGRLSGAALRTEWFLLPSGGRLRPPFYRSYVSAGVNRMVAWGYRPVNVEVRGQAGGDRRYIRL